MLLKNSLVSPQAPFGVGLIKDLSPPSGHLQVNVSMASSSTSTASRRKKKSPQLIMEEKNKESLTVESPLTIKKTILIDKSVTCPNSSQITKSSLTSVQESTSKEKDYEPSLKWPAREWSNKLWLPTGIDSVASLSNCSNGSFKSMESNSWFSIKTWSPLDTQNLQKTSLPSLTFSIAESMVKESTLNVKERTRKNKKSQKPIANMTRKVRLMVNKDPETVQTLRKWFGCVRKTYNWALSSIKKDPQAYQLSKISLREHFVTEKAIPEEMKYLIECPKHVRDGALDDLVTAYKANFTVKKKNPEHFFDLKYRSKKNEAAITIPYDAIKKVVYEERSDSKVQGEMIMYPTKLKNMLKLQIRKRDLRMGKQLKDVEFDCKLLVDRLGRFYLVIPGHKETSSQTLDNQEGAERNRWVALDPGCRTFQTAYSPKDGELYKLGDRDASRLFRLCLILDKLPNKNKKARESLRLRIKHLVDEVHWKTIRFLLDHFDNVIIPVFEVRNMVKKANRKITKKTVRNILSWRHYVFRMRLMEKAKLEGKNVFVVGEEYTTKTCGGCFKLHPKVGGAKVFKCPHCGLEVDRDAQGSRNIFLKNISVMDNTCVICGSASLQPGLLNVI